jgi:hypothetical protein
MPGLNQLEKFSTDVKDLGDEVKIRAQRGEKPATVPLPQGISEEDDSEDFVLGMPEPAPAEETDAADEGGENAAASGAAKESVSSDDTTDENLKSDIPDLDSILHPSVATGDGVPDLSDFLSSPEAPAKQKTDETPLEDLDLDALLKPTASAAETSSASDAIPDIDSIMGNSAQPAQTSAAPKTTSSKPSASEPRNPGSVQKQPSAKKTPADDFAFDGTAIDLNEDLPDEVAETDAGVPFVHAADEEAESAEEISSAEKAEEFSGAVENLDAEPAEKSAQPEPQNGSASQKFDLEPPASSFDEAGAVSAAASGAADDFDLSTFDTSMLDVPSEEGAAFTQENPSGSAPDVPPEVFDTSAMNGVDFSSEQGAAGDTEFPVTDTSKVTGGDDFKLDTTPGAFDNNFEIPGFSNTSTAAFSKKGKQLNLGTPDFSQAKSGGKPKNTLTEDEYKQFRKNLAAYPLNLRVAIEDLIVKNEFTDDAVFEIIEKVAKTTPARQVAAQLEKMLDISINVPRDYERRSVVQYEAYKSSFEYQLKNRILPGAIAAFVLCGIAYCLFVFGSYFIYRPVKAGILYRQGYTLLEKNEYSQSELKFNDAAAMKPVKRWFFRYAEGYRSHKQYERAEQMYWNILGVFNWDKQAGIDYANMELYDLANYPKAEEVTRRCVLDHHINDPDGILLLGDVFLEWADIDPSKYDAAREQYATLIQLYGQNNLYMSRMMRYFIRTDKLRDVLELKNRFYPNKKSLSGQDWIELSGYLLDKLYGKLSPADEYLRSSIEDVRDMLERGIKYAPADPVGHYNYARYFVNTGNNSAAESELENAIALFDKASVRTRKNTYREINASRLLGEQYTSEREYLKAQASLTKGIDIYEKENSENGLEGDDNTGKLYADLGDIDYFISGDNESALRNYSTAIAIKNDTPSLRYRVGAIYYELSDYTNALGSFIKAAETKSTEPNLLLALANVLSLRGDNFAAQGYYEELMDRLDIEKGRRTMLQPDKRAKDVDLLEMYVKSANNLGVTLYRLANQTGNSSMNAEALVRLSESIRAWDALTRDQKTMVRMEGSNLAAQNSMYITHPKVEYEPAIYTEIPRTMSGEKGLEP